jgi:formylmethanofuran dehydrogenase subunit E
MLLLASPCLGAEAVPALPTPHVLPQESDPAWLAYAAQFHGHLGPWATAGARLGIGARDAVGARGYFDIRVTCEGPFDRPPKSCFLDGVQVATGATLGKRNLGWVPGEQVAVRIENTRTGEKVVVRPTPKLLELLHSFKPHPKNALAGHEHKHENGEHEDNHDHDHSHQTAKLEAIARRIAGLADAELFTVMPKAD